MRPFGDRLNEAARRCGTPVCLGIDARSDSIPPRLKEGRSPAEAAEAFGLELVAAVGGDPPLVPAVKVQVAFYELLGAPGMAGFGAVLSAARDAGLLAVADVKRGDIGSTAKAYAGAYFADGAPFPADAVTASAYLGWEGIEPLLRAARERGGGVFLLLRTTNDGAEEVQGLELAGGGTVADSLARSIASWGAAGIGESGISDLGAVVGATRPEDGRRLRGHLPSAPFLIPGVGAQGASAADAAGLLLPGGRGGLVSASRSLLPPADVGDAEAWRVGVRERVEALVGEMREAIGQV